MGGANSGGERKHQNQEVQLHQGPPLMSDMAVCQHQPLPAEQPPGASDLELSSISNTSSISTASTDNVGEEGMQEQPDEATVGDTLRIEEPTQELKEGKENRDKEKSEVNDKEVQPELAEQDKENDKEVQPQPAKLEEAELEKQVPGPEQQQKQEQQQPAEPLEEKGPPAEPLQPEQAKEQEQAKEHQAEPLQPEQAKEGGAVCVCMFACIAFCALCLLLGGGWENEQRRLITTAHWQRFLSRANDTHTHTHAHTHTKNNNNNNVSRANKQAKTSKLKLAQTTSLKPSRHKQNYSAGQEVVRKFTPEIRVTALCLFSTQQQQAKVKKPKKANNNNKRPPASSSSSLLPFSLRLYRRCVG